jgi:type I restriction enzyme S subunit
MGKYMSNWQKVTLDKLCFFEKGKTGLAKAIPGDYPLVTTSAERKTNDSYQFDTKAVCIPLVSSTGHGHASLNYVHYQEGKFALGTILVALTPKDETILNAQFLHLYLSRLKDMILVPLMSGAANVSLSISKIKTVEIPLPPIDKQLKIVELFKNLVNENNELVEEINTQSSLLKQLKQTILQEAIEGKLTAKYRAKNPDIGTAKELLEQIKTEKEKLVKEKKIRPSKPLPPINEDEIPFDIPQNWEWCRLGDISFVGTGATPLTSEPKYYNGDINWITSSATGADFVTEAETKITELALKETNCQIYPIGTLVIAMYGQGKTRGQITELMIDSATNQACAAISIYLKDKALNQFIKKYFQKIYLEIRELASGGAQPNLNMQKVKDTMIALPPLEEQKEIVATIEKLFTLCNELESEINQNKTTVDNLMVTVLKESFEN